ncbi:MAG: hypothetical protein MJ184_05620 [Treponema sp.]|uniref:hypothetical protein n=1 Tax=Treponema sp. TaxID=166 RepID=UPI00298EB779|nr:hypothetical protein [Treponema sp.]MCQ2600822.1 hypothetical protein [Treponema sp.]
MKIKTIMFSICFLMTVIKITGCRTMGSEKAFSDFSRQENVSIKSNNIQVSINSIKDENTTEQLKELLDLKLKKISKADDNLNYLLDVTVNERQFIRNFENHFSLFISAKVFDRFNRLIYSNCFYSVSDESIISSPHQFQVTEKIISDIKLNLITQD